MKIFHYIYKDSLIHKIDPRFKFISMIIFGIATILLKDISENLSDFIIISFFSMILFVFTKLPAKVFLKEIKYFYIMIPIILFLSGFSFKTETSFLFHHWDKERFLTGITFSYKLILFSIISIIYIGTTSNKEIIYSLEWFFHPIPFIDESKLAFMISIVFLQIPLIFDTYQEVKNAQKSRCIDNNKNTIVKVKSLLLPIIIKIIKRADDLECAYRSRCYTGKKTKLEFKSKRSDWVYLLIFTLICISIFIF